jgi:hypothetical protein
MGDDGRIIAGCGRSAAITACRDEMCTIATYLQNVADALQGLRMWTAGVVFAERWRSGGTIEAIADVIHDDCICGIRRS